MSAEKPTPRCETCPFWDGDGLKNGDCHRHVLIDRTVNETLYTRTGPGDWCSEHPDAPPTRLERALLHVAMMIELAQFTNNTGVPSGFVVKVRQP